jgi:hypothetical protein
MADVSVPSNVSSVTFVISGVKAVSAGRITGVDAREASVILGSDMQGKNSGSEWQGFRLENANLSTGVCSFLAPPCINSITMSATPFAVSGGRITAVPAADATILATQGFGLITG